MVYNFEVEFKLFESKLDEKANLVDKYLIMNSTSVNLEFNKDKPYFYQHKDLNIITCSKAKDSAEYLSEIGLIDDLAMLEENKSKIVNLFSVDYRHQMYFLQPSINRMKQEIFESSLGWIMIGELYDNYYGSPIKGVKLKKNDILKLGRIIFKIRDTKYSREEELDQSKLALFSKMMNCGKCYWDNNSPICNCPINEYSKVNIYNISDLHMSRIKYDKNLNDKERDKDTINYNMLEKQNLKKQHTNLNNSEANNLIIVNSSESQINNDLDDDLVVSYKRKNKKYNSLYSARECRVCLNSDNEIENPLIDVCKCQGSVGLIHLDCLKQWLNNKIVTKIYAYLIVHSFKDLKCEICNSILPERIIINDKIEYLIDLKLPEKDNYIILETLSSELKDVKYLYIIHMPIGTTLLMGRNAECDIRMTDISISRIHAYLENFEGEFFIRDNNSKFGTLIKQQYEMIVLPGKSIAIQYGNSVAYFRLNKSFLSLICCLKDSSILKTIRNYNEFMIYKSCPKEIGIKTINIKKNKNSKIDVSISNHNLNESIVQSNNDYYTLDNDKLVLVENKRKLNKSLSYEIDVVDIDNNINKKIDKSNSIKEFNDDKDNNSINNIDKKLFSLQRVENYDIQSENKKSNVDLILNNLSNIHNSEAKKSIFTAYHYSSFNSIKSSVNLNENLNPNVYLDSDKMIDHLGLNKEIVEDIKNENHEIQQLDKLDKIHSDIFPNHQKFQIFMNEKENTEIIEDNFYEININNEAYINSNNSSKEINKSILENKNINEYNENRNNIENLYSEIT